MTEQAKSARAAYLRKWRQEHPDEVRASQKRWRQKNADKIKAYLARYWEKKAFAIENSKNTEEL